MADAIPWVLRLVTQMASLDLGKLKISIELDNAQANKGLDETSDKVEKVGSKGSSSLKQLGTAAGVGMAALGTASIAAAKHLYSMAQDTAATADEIDKMSQKVGMSKKGYQEWAYVLGQNGVEVETLQKGMRTFSGVMDGTSKDGVAAMNALGVSIQGMNQEEAFSATVTALQGVEDSTLRASYAAAVFGTSAAQNMMPMLNQTVASTTDLKNQANELGIVLSDDMVNAGVTMGDTMDAMNQAIQGVFNQIGGALMPVITQLMQRIVDNMPAIQATIAEITPIIAAMFESIVPVLLQMIDELLPILTQLIVTLMPIITEVFTSLLPPLLELISALLPPLTQLLSAILPVIISLIKMLTPLFQPIISLLTPILELAIALLTPLMNLINTILPPITRLITSLINSALKPLSEALGSVSKVVTDVFNVAFDAIKPILEDFQTILDGIINFITGVFTGNWQKAWTGVKDIFSGIISGLTNIFKAPINFIIGGINTFLRGLNKIKIPDWVPLVGGKGFNISEIPLLASGGNIAKSGAAIVGEAGAELVELPAGARVTPLTNGADSTKMGAKEIVQNNYFTQKALSPYETQLQIKRLSRSLAGEF